MTSGSAELELPDAFSQSRHTNNWAVLVDTSRSELTFDNGSLAWFSFMFNNQKHRSFPP